MKPEVKSRLVKGLVAAGPVVVVAVRWAIVWLTESSDEFEQDPSSDEVEQDLGPVAKLINGLGDLDEDEWDELYDQLDPDERDEVDESVSDYADNAVGDPSWRADW